MNVQAQNSVHNDPLAAEIGQKTVKNSENQRKQAILDQNRFRRLRQATLCSRKSAKSQMDPHTPSEVPIRISDPKLGAESAHKRPRELRNRFFEFAYLFLTNRQRSHDPKRPQLNFKPL